jgi:DNA-cytosine methyltransferase
MRVGSLFSGIGGMEYGLERSGLSTSCEWMIEMDEYCCSVLEKNFPNTLVLNNKVEDINPLDLPKIDILTAGFPCQPVSVAGSRKGVTDERWLWDEVWRFIDVLRPRYFILENVPGIFTANKGKAFERVIKDIAESRSYRFEWQVISARTVGAAHLRKRFFGVGTLGNTEHNGSSQSENRESIGECSISWRQGEEVQEKINRESKGESQDNSMGNSSSKSVMATNRSTTTIPPKGNSRKDNVREGSGREATRVSRETAELWMGSTAYGFPRWMARLGLVNVWTGNINNWRTPTTADKKEDALKHATKLLQGKDTRASGESVQITLADQVAMDDINNNPELFDKYKDHIMMKRPNLPEQKIFVDYLRSVTSIKELSEGTDIKKTTIEHWFRYDTSGFSYPNIEDWEKIKPFLSEVKYDKEMTTLESFEWGTSIDIEFPTAAARDWKETYGTVLTGSKTSKRKTLPLEIFRQQRDKIKDLALWEIGMPRSMGDYPDRKARLMALGNAVVPQCVELVGRLIKRADELGTMVFDVEIEESI